jgi:DNA invertase Pin-like site-specific DNA recombinase
MRPTEKPLRLVAYVRVSTDAQVDGYGLESQTLAVTSWAEAHGHRIVQVCADEGVSGTTDAFDREGLASATDAMETGIADALVLPRLDRLARQLTVQEAVLAHLWQRGGRVFCADSGEILADDADDPMRTAMRQMAGVFAQLDRAMIVKRLRDGRRVKASKGGYVSGSPRYGWRAEGGELVEDPAEHAVIARMLEMKAQKMSMNAIAAALNRDGVPAKRGGVWRADAVARVLDPMARERARRRAESARRRSAA